MSYRYLVNAVCHIGEILHSTEEYFFADGLNSLRDGIASSERINQMCKGKRHIFSVFSCNSNADSICRRLRSALGKRVFEKARVRVQFNIRELMQEIGGGISKVCADADMSMVFIENGNVYAAGYGDVNLYKYSKATGKAERIVFPASSDEGGDSPIPDYTPETTSSAITTYVRVVSKFADGDEYLILGSALADSVGDETILEIFGSNRKNPIDEIVEVAFDAGNLFTLTASRITLIKHMLPLYLWCGFGIALILAVLGLIIFG